MAATECYDNVDDNVFIDIDVGLVIETQKVDGLPWQRHHLDDHSSGSCDEHSNFLSVMPRALSSKFYWSHLGCNDRDFHDTLQALSIHSSSLRWTLQPTSAPIVPTDPHIHNHEFMEADKSTWLYSTAFF